MLQPIRSCGPGRGQYSKKRPAGQPSAVRDEPELACRLRAHFPILFTYILLWKLVSLVWRNKGRPGRCSSTHALDCRCELRPLLGSPAPAVARGRPGHGAVILRTGMAVWLQRPMYSALGQAMVDMSCVVLSDEVTKRGVARGSRNLVTVSERAEILEGLEYRLSAGGSLSNTLIDLSRLVEAANDQHSLVGRGVEFAGLVGNDALGDVLSGTDGCCWRPRVAIRGRAVRAGGCRVARQRCNGRWADQHRNGRGPDRRDGGSNPLQLSGNSERDCRLRDDEKVNTVMPRSWSWRGMSSSCPRRAGRCSRRSPRPNAMACASR